MDAELYQPVNNRKHSSKNRWCIIVTIVLALAIVLCGAIAVAFALMFNSDPKLSANSMKQQEQELAILIPENKTSSLAAEMTTPEPVGLAADSTASTNLEQDNNTPTSAETKEVKVPWQDFHGRWNLVKWSDNMEDYLIELRISWFIRKIADKISLYMQFNVDGNTIKLQPLNSFNKQPEGEFHVNTPDETLVESQDHFYKAKTTWEDGKLVVRFSESLDGEIKPQNVTRQIVNDNKEMIVTMEIGGVVAQQFYVRNTGAK